MRPLRRLRRKLQLVRYYSADRRMTPWSRARGAAIFVTLLLAVVMVPLCERLVSGEQELEQIEGQILDPGHGDPLFAVITRSDGKRRASPGLQGARLAGDWMLVEVEETAGWPHATVVRRRPLRLDRNDYNALIGDEVGVELAPGDPWRPAIEAVLREEGREVFADAWATSTAPERPGVSGRRWAAVVGGFFVWWTALAVVAVVGITAAQLVTFLATRRQADSARARAATGRCPRCGYDLRGLEFSDRCPECGTLQE